MKAKYIMGQAEVIAIIALVGSAIGPYFAYKKSTRAAEATSKNEALKVEAGAYERARKLYEDGIRQLEEQVGRLRAQLDDEQTMSEKLRTRIGDMEETISVLRSQLIRAGIELAPKYLEDK